MGTVVRAASCLEAIAARNTSLRALVHVCDAQAVHDAAAAADVRIERQQQQSAADGLVVAVKDNICTSGDDAPTTAGSAMLEGWRAPRAAACVQRLQSGGAVLVGKANLDEFAMGTDSVYGVAGPVVNPVVDAAGGAPSSAGGSSGGSAAAVAAGMCDVALGSDTGGSVRLPAARCGVVGYKPTYGLVPRDGLVAFASSLDVVGVLARTVADAACVAATMAGPSPEDATSLPSTGGHLEQLRSLWEQPQHPPPPQEQDGTHHHDAAANNDPHGVLAGLAVGIPARELYTPQLSGPVADAWESAASALVSHGATVREVALPHAEHALPVYFLIAAAEAASNLSRYDGVRYGGVAGAGTEAASTDAFFTAQRAAGFGPEVTRRILLGNYVLSSDYVSGRTRAQQLRHLITQDYVSLLSGSSGSGVDVLLLPTAAHHVPPTLAECAAMSPVAAFANDLLTVGPSLAGLPAVSVPTAPPPAGCSVPVSMQVVARHLGDDLALRVARALQWEQAA